MEDRLRMSDRNTCAKNIVLDSAHLLHSEIHTGLVSTESASTLTGIDALLAGEGFTSSNEPSEVLEYMSSLSILESTKENVKCKYQGVIVYIDREPRIFNTEARSPSKKRGGDVSDENKAIDAVLMDKTGPVLFTVFGPSAVWLSREANDLEKRIGGGEKVSRIIDVDKARIVGFQKNEWNGQFCTQLRMLQTIKAVNSEAGSQIRFVSRGDVPGLTSASYRIPATICCVTKYSSLGDELTASFRGTFHGVIMDIMALDHTQSGNPKRQFTLVDNFGTYLLCCAMMHNSQSDALKERQEVVIYYATGRKAIGRDPGMVYLLKEAIIVPIGKPRIVTQPKCNLLEIV